MKKNAYQLGTLALRSYPTKDGCFIGEIQFETKTSDAKQFKKKVQGKLAENYIGLIAAWGGIALAVVGTDILTAGAASALFVPAIAAGLAAGIGALQKTPEKVEKIIEGHKDLSSLTLKNCLWDQ